MTASFLPLLERKTLQTTLYKKKCVRIIDNLYYNEHTGDNFKTQKILKLDDITNLAALKMAWGIFHEEAPEALWYDGTEKNNKLINKYRVPERGFPGQISHKLTTTWNQAKQSWKDAEKVVHVSRNSKHRYSKPMKHPVRKLNVEAAKKK